MAVLECNLKTKVWIHPLANTDYFVVCSWLIPSWKHWFGHRRRKCTKTMEESTFNSKTSRESKLKQRGWLGELNKKKTSTFWFNWGYTMKDSNCYITQTKSFFVHVFVNKQGSIWQVMRCWLLANIIGLDSGRCWDASVSSNMWEDDSASCT